MGREVERKYLVKGEAWRRAGHGVRHRQGYLSTDPDRSVRVRVAGNEAFITVKGKSKGAARDEYEYTIPIGDAKKMLRTLCVKPLIEKTRYVIKDGERKWEIDKFARENKGLVIAELETDDDSRQIEKPDWVGDEVTGDPRYFNLNLVRHPFSEWRRRSSRTEWIISGGHGSLSQRA
jgi:adenylate cyclase